MKHFLKKLIPGFLVSYYHLFLAFLGAVIYRFPSKKLKVIGVTGTNGKSTVVEFITKVFEEAIVDIASQSSIRFKIKDKEMPNTYKMTMPGRFFVQKFLRQAVNTGCKYAVLEVTSEGIKQHRHRFIQFDAAVFTNLSPEHIESHGSFENYKKAKGKLFKACKKIHVVNAGDKNAEYFLQFKANKKYLYQLENQNAKIKIIDQNSAVLQEINGLDINLKLLGSFNIANALAAISVGLSQGIELGTCKKAIEKIDGIPGRMEEVISQPFKVFVDYAVTPDALEGLYLEMKKMFPSQKIIAVFGSCGGGRDKWRRPVLGEIAAKYCDKIIITNEDPYDEDPNIILSEIKSGILKPQSGVKSELSGRLNVRQNEVSGTGFTISNFYEILDRKLAIKKAFELAGSGDIVVITGKGCEPWICVAGGKKIPWDDRQIAREVFAEKFSF